LIKKNRRVEMELSRVEKRKYALFEKGGWYNIRGCV